MEDTTDKSVSPVETTESEEALTDKDLGQETPDTGESQDGSKPSDQAPADGSDTQEDEAEDDQTTSEEEGGDTDEGSLLTPEEVAKLPKELKGMYVSMNKAFQGKMRLLNQKLAETNRPPEGDATPQPTEPDAERPVFIDRTKLAKAKSQDEIVAVLEEGVLKAAEYVAGQKVNQAVAPFHDREAAAEVRAYWEKFPDRKRYDKAMGRLDAKTHGTLTLDQLYHAVSGADREKAEQERKDRKLRNLSKGNADTASGQSGKPSGEGDVFDDIAKAGGHGSSPLF